MPFKLEAACCCNTGKLRSNNEDNFFFNGSNLPLENDGLCDPLTMELPLTKKICLAVFDGMGGENFGEEASFAAAEYMKNIKYSWKDRLVPERQYLKDMCLKVNDAVVSREKELCTDRMGSTLVAVYFSGPSVYVCNLGDSRAYCLRNGEMLQVSKDHVLKREGMISRKAPLTQHLGIDPEEFSLEPHIAKSEIKNGDQYLLCSDGLTDMLTDGEICEIMASADTAERCAQRLVDAALDKGGRDNITVIVCRVSGSSQKELSRWPYVIVGTAAVLTLALIGYFGIHNWQPATCTQPKTCLICGKTEGDALGHLWMEASEEVPKTCSVCGLEEGAALGHAWGEADYIWSDDYSTVAARRVCTYDSGHVEMEMVEATGEITKAATCEKKGETTYTSLPFHNSAFSIQSKTVANIPALGHTWGEAAYLWSNDCSKVFARRICTNDESHIEMEIVKATGEITKAATCEEKGETTYTSLPFHNSAFSIQSKTIANIPALGHDWSMGVWPDSKFCRRCGKNEPLGKPLDFNDYSPFGTDDSHSD